MSGGVIYGVGLGPGDPELMSVRADRLVRGAKHVAYFRKAGRMGQARRIVEGMLRPDDVVHDDASPLRAKVIEKSFRGSEFLYTLELASGARVISSVPSHHDHHDGEMIGIRLETDHVVVFERRNPD